jgi:hypothetical protein
MIPSPRPAAGAVAFGSLVLALAANPAPAGAAASDSLPVEPAAAGPARVLLEAGLENVTAGDRETGFGRRRTVAFENRRYRHSAEARGIAARLLPVPPSATLPVTFFERRLGQVAAAIVDTGSGVPTAVLFPSDGDFPDPPPGDRLAPTSRNVDLLLRPRVAYELGRILDPVLLRLELEPILRWNPWPGGRASASVVIPVRNDFSLDELHPDINRTRPGLLTVEQFLWWRRVALLSATGGLFGQNRYGLSVGAARPAAEGALLLDAQADLTGYIAFPEGGAEYSTPGVWSGFAGVTWRPPTLDLGVRARAVRFLHGDQGGEIELRRTMGDLEVAFFYQRTAGASIDGLRLTVPIPPMRRPTDWPVRALPVERFPFEYRDASGSIGRSVAGVASREEHLRQLSRTGLAANAWRYEPNARRPGNPGIHRVSMTGMTGFVNTPWAGVIGDREVETGYNRVPAGGAWDHRGEHRNDVYYAALGFLPRVEAGVRWTVIPGLRAFADVVPESRLTDADRMLSGRVCLFEPGPRRPGLAVGVEDVRGTRRFHSTYIVGGIPFAFRALQNRVSLGYAPRVFTAGRHTLDGLFGAIEASPWRQLAAAAEYDTEKWNASLGAAFGVGLRLRVTLLDGNHVGGGAGWYFAL